MHLCGFYNEANSDNHERILCFGEVVIEIGFPSFFQSQFEDSIKASNVNANSKVVLDTIAVDALTDRLKKSFEQAVKLKSDQSMEWIEEWNNDSANWNQPIRHAVS